MTVRARSKYDVSSSRTVSASRPSESDVKPTRSANRTLTTRRSATGTELAAGSERGTAALTEPGPAAVAAPSRRVPHSPQNRAFPAFAEPHDWQVATSRPPQA